MSPWRISRGNSQRRGPKAGVYLEGFKEQQESHSRLERSEQEGKKDYKLDYNVCMLNKFCRGSSYTAK